ncbi:hypothetical protein ACSNOE_12865, partial [Streptomyces radiopugnans]
LRPGDTRWPEAGRADTLAACHSSWGTDDGRNYVVQGYVITEPERLAQLDLPEGETAVTTPAAVLEEYFGARG